MQSHIVSNKYCLITLIPVSAGLFSDVYFEILSANVALKLNFSQILSDVMEGNIKV